MSKIELTLEQKAAGAVTAKEVARIMEPEPTWNPDTEEVKGRPRHAVSPLGFWMWRHTGDCETYRWEPRFFLDGTDLKGDAEACYLMKEKLIELGCRWVKSSCRQHLAVPWMCNASGFPDVTQNEVYRESPIEALAVAEVLVAVAKQRQRSNGTEQSHG